MGLYELTEMGYEEQLMFAREYLPLVYERLVDMGEDMVMEKDPNDLSPMLPSFDSDDEMFFTRNGRRIDK